MIDDIVAMHAAGASFEYRRCVYIGDAEIAQIPDQLFSVGKAEVFMKLQAIGRRRNPHYVLCKRN